MTLGQIVMVAVMTMTPLQMRHAGQGLRLVGLVISVHVLGMYAFSPVMGWAADRFGRRAVIGGGAALLLASTAVAGTAAAGDTRALSVGLLLLGLGWNATLVGGSTMLVDAVPAPRRAAAQGAADMVMSGTGGLGGAVSGLVVTTIGYGGLNLLGALLTLGLVAALLVTRPARGRRPARGDLGPSG